MFASTHVLRAGPELRQVQSVLRVSETPATETVVCALSVVTPVAAESRSMVQSPLAFVEHEELDTFPLERPPGPESIEKVTSAPFAGAEPVPSFTFTCAVNVCVVPTSFVAVGGEIWMFASTTRNGSHGPSEP